VYASDVLPASGFPQGDFLGRATARPRLKDVLADHRQHGAAADGLLASGDLELAEFQAIELSRGFGRDWGHAVPTFEIDHRSGKGKARVVSWRCEGALGAWRGVGGAPPLRVLDV